MARPLILHALACLDGGPADGVHLHFEPPADSGWSVGGFSVYRRDAHQVVRPPAPCVSALPSELAALHRFGRARVPGLGTLRFHRAALGVERRRALARYAPTPAGTTESCIYELALDAPCVDAELRTDGWFAIAMLGERAVDSAAPARGVLRGPIDRLLIHAPAPLPALTLCPGPAVDAGADGPGWQLIADSLQLPVQTADATLHDHTAERERALSRLIPGERLEGDLDEVARLLHYALAGEEQLPPTRACAAQRPNVLSPFVHHRPWATVMGLMLDPGWRRALGFGHVDRASGLRRGGRYDYKVVGSFRRRDLEERRLDFAAVPAGTLCGQSFALGGVTLHLSDAAQVTAEPPPGSADVWHPYRKGVRFDGVLRLVFPAPIRRVALLAEPLARGAVTWNAEPSGGGVALSGTVSEGVRTLVELPAAVQQISLHGRGLFFGLCEPCLPTGVDGETTIVRTATALGVTFEGQPLPEPPRLQRIGNLQQPLRPGVTQPVHGLGFRLRWLPPPRPGRLPELLWPPDLPSAPPSDIARYIVERADSVSGVFFPYDAHLGADATGSVLASRARPAPPVGLTAGADLLALFPEKVMPLAPISPWIELTDVLVGPRRETDIRPGSRHRYRIVAIDALGRRSTAALTAEAVLRKRLPPPMPPGPDPRLEPVRSDGVRPAGVYARVVQHGDRGLDALDRLALGTTRSHVTVLHWSWGAEQRRQDPFTTEFRIYWRQRDPARLSGWLTGSAAALPDGWRLAVELDQPVQVDELAGRILEMGRSAFPVRTHGAGMRLDIVVGRSRVSPAALPEPGPFQFVRLPAGAESRPERWDERVRIVPLPASPEYVHFAYAIETGLLLTDPSALPTCPVRELYAITADGPSVRGFVGISAADAQTYVADVVPGTLGGRPGNESAIVPAAVWAEHHGRPALSARHATAAPVQTLAEVSGEQVEVTLRLPDLLPEWRRPEPLFVERVAGSELTRLLVLRAEGVFVRRHADDGPDELLPASLQDELGNALAAGRGLDSRELWHLATSGSANLEALWKQVGTAAVAALDTVLDRVPNTPDRYLYRVRVSDARGRRSAGSAYVERIFRTPDRSPPPVPALESVRAEEAQLLVSLSVPAGDLVSGVLLFVARGSPDAARGYADHAPELLRTPNRPDLYPSRGIRARLRDATLLAPIFLPTSDSVPVPDARRRRWEATIEAGHDAAVGLWAATVSPDGIASMLAGPRIAQLGPALPIAPPLTVARGSSSDVAAWTAPAAQLTRLEAAPEAADHWSAASPWLPGGASVTRSVVPPDRAGRRYRLRVRGAGGREATGEPVHVGP